MKHVIFASILLLTLNVAHAKKSSHKKISKEEARELCLTTKGASIPEKALKKCVKKAMQTGKV